MTKIQTLRKQLKAIEGKLPHGSKQKITDSLSENYNNVVGAFKGLTGEDLTKKVLSEARKILRKHQPKKRKPAAQAV